MTFVVSIVISSITVLLLPFAVALMMPEIFVVTKQNLIYILLLLAPLVVIIAVAIFQLVIMKTRKRNFCHPLSWEMDKDDTPRRAAELVEFQQL